MIPYKDLTPSRGTPLITMLLVSANVALFLYALFLPSWAAERFINSYSVIPYEFKLGHNISISPGLPPFLTIFTAMFLHGGWLHLIGNLLYLWIFGDNVEARMGHFRFLIFYLLCGAIATVVQIYTSFHSKIPALGASGAIAGVLASYLRLFPKGRIAVLVPIVIIFRTIVLPAWLVLGIWFLLQLADARFSPSPSGGIAYFAHIGGFIVGFLLVPLFVRKKRPK